MKNSAAFISNRIAAISGKLILSIYNLYTSAFVKKDDLTFDPPPIRRQEIILVKRTHKVYNVAAKQYSLS